MHWDAFGSDHELWNQTAHQSEFDLGRFRPMFKRTPLRLAVGIKQFPYVMWSGGYLMKDVSSPDKATPLRIRPPATTSFVWCTCG